MITLLILNYIIWIYEAITYNKRILEMNIDEMTKDMAMSLKPIVLAISLIPYISLVDFILKPLIKKYFNL